MREAGNPELALFFPMSHEASISVFAFMRVAENNKDAISEIPIPGISVPKLNV